ncbi:MAG: VWA domain-containing protein, partial [Clostridiales bacterium]|nr:VWA domain-containing protein [Clostridiales bacterium]
MVYKKKTEPTPGGTAVIDTSDETWPEGNDAPKFSKSSSHNDDGTNTVELSIVAGAKPVEESTPADVIVIFDVSGSMRSNMAGTQNYGNATTQAQNMNHNSRLWLAADAVNKMANILLNGSNHDVRMSLITFSNTATVVQSFTNSYSTFSGKVNTLTADGGTNWEKALYLANTQSVRSDAATFIVFVTDGDPTFRMSRGNVADNNIDIDDGYYRQYQVFGAGGSDAQGRNLSFAVDQVSAIAGANKEFYAIGISTAVTKVRNLTTQGGVDESHAFIASDSTAMDNAFESITESIKSTLGFGDVGLTDGITELSSTRMEVMHSVDDKSFKYYITDASGRREWTTREADGCAPATYNEETGAVEWNMGDGFQLEDDVTYTVTFVVWPSQKAYDLVADLNNGVKSYDSLTAAEKAQIVETVAVPNNIYSLKTNTDNVKASYKKTSKTGDVVSIADDTPIEIDATYGTMENMSLTSMLLKVHKDFEDDLTAGEDRVDEVVLVLKRRNAHQDPEAEFVEYPVPQAGGVVSANIVLNEANNWTYSLYIAPGFEVDGEILEHGYDFTIEEPDINYHYGLIEEIINPMVVDGEERYYGDGYLLDDEQVIQQYVDRSLTAVNRVKSGIDIRKVVVDDDGAEISSTEEFTIKGKILGTDGNPYTFDNAALDQRTDKNSSTWVPANQSAHQNDPIAYHKYVEDPEAVPGTNGAIEAYGKKYRRTIYKGHFDSTAAIEFTLKTNELLRFINVPEGCTFEFDEDMTKM